MPTMPSPEIRLKKGSEFAFSPDSRRVAFIGGRYVTMLELGTRESRFAVHPIANPSHLDFSPDGRFLVVKGTSGRTILLDAQTGSVLRDFRNQKEGEGDSAFFTACSRFVVSVAWRGFFSVRDCESSEVMFSQSYAGECQLSELSCTAHRDVFVYCVGRSPRSPGGNTPCTIEIHRWPTRAAKAESLPKEWEAIWGLQVSPSGRFVAIVHGTPADTLEIYDIEHSRTVAQCPWSGSPGCSIAWSRDERMIVTNGDDCFRVYELPALKVALEVPAPFPCFARFSPNEEFIALGSWKQSRVIPTASLKGLARTGDG
jgi:WD40 repeat protein